MTGRVKNVTVDKGYGFIMGEDGVEYFFHMSALQNITIEELQKNQEVEFEGSEGLKGPRAEGILA